MYQKDVSNSKNITFRITLSHNERTLVTDEVNEVLDEVSKDAGQKLKAQKV